MYFKKKNTVLSAAASRPLQPAQAALGLRPSPLDGRLTTSTGTSSLDQLLAGHAGLPLGTCLLVEEHGTTDFSGVLLRYYAAEGLVQGHHVHTVASPPAWRHDLPGLVVAPSAPPSQPTSSTIPAQEDKMKIAWRYEALGNNKSAPSPTRPDGFCHSFDLARRLAPASCKGTLLPVPFPGPYSLDCYRGDSAERPSAFKAIVHHLASKLEASGPGVVHRLVVPSLLNPSLYPPACCRPAEVLQFLHGLRGLLRRHSAQLTVLMTLPVSLFPRDGGLTRWMELLCDGVIELIPQPAQSPAAAGSTRTSSDRAKDDAQQSQGLVRIHSLPVFHERGGGGGGGATLSGETLSFNLSASRGLVIKPYSLPPMVEDDHKDMPRPASTAKDGIDF